MEKIAKLFQENSEQIISNVGTAGGVGLGGWIGITIGVGIILFIIGGVIALIVSKKMFEKQIRENPPITEAHDSRNVHANGSKTIWGTN